MNTPTRLATPWHTPESVARRLTAEWGENGLIWLDGDNSAFGRWVTMAVDPLEQHCCRGHPGEAGARNPFTVLRQLTPGHWCGWLSYEAAAWTEPGNPWTTDGMASLWIARHDPVLRFDLVDYRGSKMSVTVEPLRKRLDSFRVISLNYHQAFS